ncbi:hypothetical protein PFICI_08766 [Pestalotiopsis fici W106-1]|uniref:Mitochondrial resolvase Ydc2 catalytic domain-containing protein n=1 Tax=Pestalotiopsis fici (strain W106-1 / CGMCC3.15140) TaxID=1229662 RepID=W3WYG0_PESFW|nr:uncharacterized protein PFICI_08766 [Pestalotiopsis fici W106-1]ETS78913.1 hypothetical protein PFICI_08766 [Pestalotiopsis fici W106-1]
MVQSAAKLVQSLNSAQLKKLAIACGVASSGTKTVLAQRLEATAQALAQNKSVSASDKGILSIDMGIRNLAFAYLVAPASRARNKRSLVGVNAPVPNVDVKLWNRMVLADPQLGQEAHVEEARWSPSYMADMTLDLVQNVLLGPENPPAYILIERQRFRSGGGSAVQEWTLRVNTFEAMLYSTLRTLKSCGRWSGQVIPISPQRVGPFWLEGAAHTELSKPVSSKSELGKVTKAKQKKAKIDLVGNWLQDGKIVPSGQAQVTATSYLERWNGKRTRKSRDETESVQERLQKLDDLADSLLQGLAWIKWQDNIRLLDKDGPEALLEEAAP